MTFFQCPKSIPNFASFIGRQPGNFFEKLGLAHRVGLMRVDKLLNPTGEAHGDIRGIPSKISPASLLDNAVMWARL